MSEEGIRYPTLTTRAPFEEQELGVILAEQSTLIDNLHSGVVALQKRVRTRMEKNELQDEINRLRKLIVDKEIDDYVKGMFTSKRARNTVYAALAGFFVVGSVLGAAFF